MNQTPDLYRERRDKCLSELVTALSQDERFVAGWLTGSLSRNEADSISDIDLSLVVSDAYATSLCARFTQVGAETSPERYSLFSQFGTPALIHENNNNAPDGGTFTFVLYAQSVIMVDWVLIPQSKAVRPYQSQLLFDKAEIPLSTPPDPENLAQRQSAVAEQWAFFWMMIPITIKYIARKDGVFATIWTEQLHSMISEIERWLNGEPWKYHRGSLSQFQNTPEKQIELLKQLCQRMQELQPKVTEFTGLEPMMPIAEIETLFSFAQSEIVNR